MEYIDMHSHILPGLDDGSKNMEMTLAMLRVAVEEGIGTIYTTPHCMPGKGHPTLAKVEERIRLVQEAAEAEGIQITLKKGTEYYYIEEMSEWMEEGKIITLGDSHCVLVEFEPYAEEKYIRNAVREILGFGYQPVIAHVERYRNLMERKFAAIQWMREIGALIQVNCASVTGDNGFTTKQNVKSLLKNGLSSVASVLLNRAARPYGDEVIAAFIIVNRLVHMCQQIYFGLGEGYQTVCSYNYGAKQYHRVRQGFWYCIKVGAALLVMIAVAFLFPEELIGLFRKDDPEVIYYGSRILRASMATLSLLPVCATGFVMLQGIGRNRDAAIVGSGRQGLFLLPLILILPRLFGVNGLIAVQPCSDVLSTLLGVWILRPNLRRLKALEENHLGIK